MTCPWNVRSCIYPHTKAMRYPYSAALYVWRLVHSGLRQEKAVVLGGERALFWALTNKASGCWLLAICQKSPKIPENLQYWAFPTPMPSTAIYWRCESPLRLWYLQFYTDLLPTSSHHSIIHHPSSIIHHPPFHHSHSSLSRPHAVSHIAMGH